MHKYHVDESLRNRVLFVTAVLAIIAAFLLDYIASYFPIAIPWWIEKPSILGFFGLFIWLYDSFFWKHWPFQWLPWFYIPDISGTWKVEIRSSYHNFTEPVFATSVIRQNGSKICVAIRTNGSWSYSTFATLIRAERLNLFELTYHYLNEPDPDSIETMNIHRGTVWLQISADRQSLYGEYYSGRGRQHFGRIVFTR